MASSHARRCQTDHTPHVSPPAIPRSLTKCEGRSPPIEVAVLQSEPLLGQVGALHLHHLLPLAHFLEYPASGYFTLARGFRQEQFRYFREQFFRFGELPGMNQAAERLDQLIDRWHEEGLELLRVRQGILRREQSCDVVDLLFERSDQRVCGAHLGG